MKKPVPIILVVLFSGLMRLSAQEVGHVEIIRDENINVITEQYKKINQQDQAVDGYRVQIFFDSGSNSKKRASDAMDEFLLKYPGTRVFLSFKAPYYRVRAGNFRTLTEAIGFQKKISSDYPNAFPVKRENRF